MYYQKYITQEKYDEIVNGYEGCSPDTFPHCNQTTFHEPGVCAYCDGYFKRHPGFIPASYAPLEANGWGGNKAPIVDNVLAYEEKEELELLLGKIVSGEHAQEERQKLHRRVQEILDTFIRRKKS